MRFSAKQRHILYLEFSKLLRAGFPIENALKTLGDQPLRESQLHFVRETAAGLKRGLSIADAVRAIPEIRLTEVETNLIDAGERGGKLAEVFRQLASFYRKVDLSRKSILAQMFYPVALLHVAILLSAFVRVLVEDRWDGLWPALTTLFIIYAVVAAGVWGYFAYFRKQAPHKASLDYAANLIPVVGQLRKALAMERFCQVFRIYLITGFKPSDGILAAAEASQSGELLEAARAIKPQLEAGLALGPLLKLDVGAFPEDFATSMATAEEAGALDEELARWHRHYTYETEEGFSRLQTWLPRGVYTLIVIYVAYIILKVGINRIQDMGELLDTNPW